MGGNVVELCLRCTSPARWRVCDSAGGAERLACDEHMPRVVSRTVRRIEGPAIVAPMFAASHVSDLAPLLMVGADVYGMVSDPTAALAVEGMTTATRETVVAALRRPLTPLRSSVRVVPADEARVEVTGDRRDPIRLFDNKGERVVFGDDE